MQCKLLISPWKNEFIATLGKTKKELFVSSPFINLKGVTVLLKAIQKRSSIELSLITNLTTQNILNGVTEPVALLKLYEHFPQVKISSLGRLHAKIYLIDNEIGIVTLANLTSGGLISNFEYGVKIEDKNIISTIKEDMSKYYSLGNILDRDLLEKVNNMLHGIKSKTDELAKNKELAQLLKQSTENLDLELLRNRIKEGKTINGIFSDTILYLLKKKGAISTKEIHPLIQTIHPDICDDSIDRVIHGQHFGKKWKHLVRSAQQSLKQKGLIYSEKGKWKLTT